MRVPVGEAQLEVFVLFGLDIGGFETRLWLGYISLLGNSERCAQFGKVSQSAEQAHFLELIVPMLSMQFHVDYCVIVLDGWTEI